jgi:hypothetical protein
MKNIKIWIKLGVTLETSEEQAQKILTGDKSALMDFINPKNLFDGKWYLDGESYIPEPIANDLGYKGEIEFNF